MPEYTVLTGGAVAAVVAAEVLWARTGLFRSGRYWITLAIVFGFQVLVDGRLTRLPDPVVAYNPAAFTGVRLAGSIPVEDFGFGFAMVTATLILWRVAGRRERAS